MAIAAGDLVIPRTIVSTGNDLSPGLMAQPPRIGRVVTFVSPDAEILWDDGKFIQAVDVVAAPPVLRIQVPSSLTRLYRFVTLPNAQAPNGEWVSPEMQGVVIQLLDIEMTPLSDVFILGAVVRTRTGMFWLIEAGKLTIVPDR